MKYSDKPTNELKAGLAILAIMAAVVIAFLVYAWLYHGVL